MTMTEEELKLTEANICHMSREELEMLTMNLVKQLSQGMEIVDRLSEAVEFLGGAGLTLADSMNELCPEASDVTNKLRSQIMRVREGFRLTS